MTNDPSPIRLTYYRYRLRLDREIADTFITVPLPARLSFESARFLIETGVLIEGRLRERYGPGRIEGKGWVIRGCEALDESTVRRLYPEEILLEMIDDRPRR